MEFFLWSGYATFFFCSLYEREDRVLYRTVSGILTSILISFYLDLKHKNFVLIESYLVETHVVHFWIIEFFRQLCDFVTMRKIVYIRLLVLNKNIKDVDVKCE